jgi:hypothetical protein
MGAVESEKMKHQYTLFASCVILRTLQMSCAQRFEVFFIRPGKLYLHSSTAEQKLLLAKEEEDVVAANRNWLQQVH